MGDDRSGLRRTEPVDLSYKDYLSFSKEPEIVRFGNMTLGYAAWGDYESVEDYIARHNIQDSKELKLLRRLGFDGGYRYPDYCDVLSPEIQKQQALYATMFIERLMGERGWDGVEMLAVASTSSKIETLRMIPEMLWEKGLKAETLKIYLLACASSAVAMMDIARNFSGIRAMVVGFDSLSGSKVRPGDHLMYNLFGNGVSGIAFRPFDEIEFVNGSTHIERDEKGVVKTPPAYSLPDGERISPPQGYVVADNAKHIFAVTDEGIFLELPSSQPYAEVDGAENFNYFAARTPPIAIEEFGYDYFPRKKRGEKVNPVLSHQASYPIVTAIGLELRKFCRENGIPFDLEKDFPWLMKGTKMCNVSPVTILTAFTQGVKTDRFKLGLKTGILGMGVGSAIHAGVFIPKS